jgi:hypothetical protein
MLEDGRWRAQQHRLRTAVLVGIWGIFACVLLAAAYTGGTLAYLRSRGVYPSAEAGMWALIERGYRNPELVEIIYAGTNSFDGSDPNVWYVIACVWGGERADGARSATSSTATTSRGASSWRRPTAGCMPRKGCSPSCSGL